jgi:hypothetical protein
MNRPILNYRSNYGSNRRSKLTGMAWLTALVWLSTLPSVAQSAGKQADNRDGDGGWWMAPEEQPRSDVELSQHEKAMLETLGYLPGYEPAEARSGITVHNEARAQAGLNFYTSGHEPSALLMTMQGEILHRWSLTFERAFPQRRTARGHKWVEFWRRAHLFPNGDVLAIFEDNGVIKLDKNSKLLWRFYGEAHHDLDVAADGSIYVLTRRSLKIPRVRTDKKIYVDFVTVLNAKGKKQRQVDLYSAFEKSPYASFLKGVEDAHAGDIFHTNTVQVLDGRHVGRSSVFKKGNVLVSMRNLDVIAIVDMDTGLVVWALSGMWSLQHEPQLLPNGNMLVFDNRGHQGMSKVLEFEPLTQKVIWGYRGTPANGFYSAGCGTNQRLSNGNTLITESMGGRALEVTSGGEIVWEFVSPHRAGEQDELVAVLLDVMRLPPGFPLGWLVAD